MTLIGQVIAMAVFVWFCMKYIWPVINGAIEARQTEIASGLAAAEQGASSLERAKTEADKIIAGRPYLSKAHLVTRNILSGAHYAQIKDQIIARQK